MASPLIVILAASGLVSAGVPAAKNAPAAQPQGMVTATSKAPAGACMVPSAKGKVTKLSAIRKARDGRSCSFQFMQGATGAGTGAGMSTATTTVLTVAGSAAGAAGGAALVNSNNNQPNP